MKNSAERGRRRVLRGDLIEDVVQSLIGSDKAGEFDDLHVKYRPLTM